MTISKMKIITLQNDSVLNSKYLGVMEAPVYSKIPKSTRHTYTLICYFIFGSNWLCILTFSSSKYLKNIGGELQITSQIPVKE